MTREERWSPGDEPDDGEKVAPRGRQSGVLMWAKFTSVYTNTSESTSVKGRLIFCYLTQSVHQGSGFSFHASTALSAPNSCRDATSSAAALLLKHSGVSGFFVFLRRTFNFNQIEMF